jgi:hypothetical protein
MTKDPIKEELRRITFLPIIMKKSATTTLDKFMVIVSKKPYTFPKATLPLDNQSKLLYISFFDKKKSAKIILFYYETFYPIFLSAYF